MKLKNCLYLFVSAAIFCGCAGVDGTAPEQVVSAFNEALIQGRFGDAASLCDTLLMDGYLKRYEAGWKRAAKMNGRLTSAAQSALADIRTEIVSVEKDGDKRVVCYKVGIPGSTHAKVKKAVLGKEEGEWRIKSVTEEN